MRWHIEEGHIVFPKSENPKHIQENIDIFDFTLSEQEIESIRSLDQNLRFFDKSIGGIIKFMMKSILKR